MNSLCLLSHVEQSALSKRKAGQAAGKAFPGMTRKCELLVIKHRSSG
jgi:hypothetical protein